MPKCPSKKPLLLFCLAFFLSAWGFFGQAAQPAAAQDDAPPQTASAPTSILYLPQILQVYPRPAGFDLDISERVHAVNADRMLDTTDDLVRLYGPRYHELYQRITNNSTCALGGTVYTKHNLLRALNYAEDILTTLGYQVTHEPVANSNGSYNLVATRPASAATTFATYLEVGAHLDTREATPGATDNASGSAGVLEMAAVLANYPNQHPWRFILFVEEEFGMLGSQVHVQKLTSKNFKSALVMDCIGWSEADPETMNCIYANANIPETVEIANLFDAVRGRYGIDIGYRRCTYSSWFSDQGRYWEADLPAVLSVGGLPYTNPTLHQCNDNMAHLNSLNAFQTVQENVAVFLTLDQEP